MVRQSEVVLVIVAHTDDETLGVGGTIARHVENGDIVYGISMTNGVGSREGKQYESIQQRREAALWAANILGLTWLVEGNFPDNEMDTISMLSVTKVIESVKDQIKPTIVYTHSMADLNIDHRTSSLKQHSLRLGHNHMRYGKRLELLKYLQLQIMDIKM